MKTGVAGIRVEDENGLEISGPVAKHWSWAEHFGTAMYTDNGQNSWHKIMCVALQTDKSITSSRLNNTPPIGAPKATDTPAAAAADKTYDAKPKISE